MPAEQSLAMDVEVSAADDDAVPAQGTGFSAFSWVCAQCNTENGIASGLPYSYVCCASCQAASPTLKICAENGLALAWVPSDGDCFIHSTFDDEHGDGVRGANLHNSEYMVQVLKAREYIAKQMVSSSVREGDDSLSVDLRIDAARYTLKQRRLVTLQGEAERQFLRTEDYAVGAISDDEWRLYFNHVRTPKGRWIDAELEGRFLAAFL